MFAATGLVFGATAMVKSEPLVFGVVISLYLWLERRDRRDFVRAAAITFTVAGAVILPWTIRNYVVFDRFIPTAAGGGMIVAAANHEGGTGGNDMQFLLAYLDELGVRQMTQAEQGIAMNDDGWRRARQFVMANPGEAGRILLSKLRLTYGRDSEGAELVRGFFGRDNWHLSEAVWRRLALAADVYWAVMGGLVLLGLGTVRGWARGTRVLLFGLIGTWLALHLVFLGGARFHFSEIIVYAMVAAAGVDGLMRRFRSTGEIADTAA